MPLGRLGVAEFLLLGLVDRKWRETLRFTTREPTPGPNNYLTDVQAIKTNWAHHLFYFFMSLQKGHEVFSGELFDGLVRLTDNYVCSVYFSSIILSLVLLA